MNVNRSLITAFPFVLLAVHAVLETAHALAKALHEFRYLLSSEKKQYHKGNDDNLL